MVVPKIFQGDTSGIPDAFKAVIEAKNEESNKKNCEAAGGKWDSVNKVCILPEPPKVKPDVPEVGEIIDSAKQTVTLPDGRTFTGLNKEDIALLAQQQAEKRELPEGTEIAGAAQARADIEFERQRLIREEVPQRRELEPKAGFGETIPVFGGIIGVGRRFLQDAVQKFTGKKIFKNVRLEPEELKTVALTEIERQEIRRGLTFNEQFGAFVEGIPIAGSLLTNFAGGLIETPSENAREVKSNILKEKRRISNIETNVKLGYLPVPVAREQIIDIESNVQRLESRIRMLINNSPELRFNSDYVNTIETEILATREKAFQAKQNILTGATQDPMEIQLLQKLQSLKSEEEI